MGHIQLSRSADLVVVCPATADLMAKAVHGHANDLASTTLLATDTPVLMVPALAIVSPLSGVPGVSSAAGILIAGTEVSIACSCRCGMRGETYLHAVSCTAIYATDTCTNARKTNMCTQVSARVCR